MSDIPTAPLTYEARDAFGRKRHRSLGDKRAHHQRFLKQAPYGLRWPKIRRPKRPAAAPLTADELDELTSSERFQFRLALKHRVGWRGRA